MSKKPQQQIDQERLLELMKANGMTTRTGRIKKAVLARIAGVSPSQVERWLNRQHGPMPENVRRMAEHFGVSEIYLYGGNEDEEREYAASVVQRALGSKEADVIRGLGLLPEERRDELCERILAWTEGYGAVPVPDRKTSVSMQRPDVAAAQEGSSMIVSEASKPPKRRGGYERRRAAK